MLIRIFRTTLVCGALLLLVAGLSAQTSVGAGTYEGSWSGESSSGAIHITLRADNNGRLTPAVAVTVDGQEVACKVREFKVDGAKISFVSDVDVEGGLVRAVVQGTANGKTLDGTFEASDDGGVVQSGKWSASAT